MVALQYRLPNDDKDAAQIKRCPIDDLPNHIKRDVNLEPEDKRGAKWSSAQKGYLAKIHINNFTRDSYQEQPVKFIRNKETRIDNWYLLVSQNTKQGLEYYTNKFG